MKSLNRFIERKVRVIANGVLFIVALVLLAPMSTAASPSQEGVSWDYKLLGNLNSAQNSVTGRTIVITGSGSFDLSQSNITGGGSYTILDVGGSVVGSGTWAATKFDSFTPTAPGGSPGEGGHLELEAQFSGTGTGTLSDSQHVVIQCSMWSTKVGPPGYPWLPDFVEVGSYTIHKTGGVMFNLNQ